LHEERVTRGFGVPGDIDFVDIAFASATLAYAGNSLSGVLTVSDGTRAAHLTLMGDYAVGNFQIAGDGGSGTLVIDPPVTNANQVFLPSH
jgi:hypothetical protein